MVKIVNKLSNKQKSSIIKIASKINLKKSIKLIWLKLLKIKIKYRIINLMINNNVKYNMKKSLKFNYKRNYRVCKIEISKNEN